MGQTVEGDSTVLAELYVNTGGPEGFWSPDWPYDRVTEKFTSDPSNWPGVTVNQNTGLVTRVELAGFGLSGNLPEDFSPPKGVSALAGLKVLDLSNNTNLSGTITSEFMSFMSSVETLNISGVRIQGAIPSNINTLTKLIHFNISSTNISSIPAEIGSMTKLVKLNLSNNFLTSLPASIYQLSDLSELYLNNNSLDELPDNLTTSSNQVRIFIQNNKLDFCDLEKLKVGFPNAVIISSPQASSGNLLPEVVEASLGGNISLEADICGQNNSYQWQRRANNQWENLSGKTASILEIDVVGNLNGAVYRCKVNNLSTGELTIYSKQYKLQVTANWAPDFEIETQEDANTNFDLFSILTPDQQLAFFDILIESNFEYEFKVTKQPLSGKISQESQSGTFVYTPNADFFGEDIIEYSLKVGNETKNAKVTITIKPVNDRPVLKLFSETGEVLSPFELEVVYGSTVSFKAVLDDSKDGEFACETLELASNSSSLNGTISYDAATQIATYTPTQNITDSDVITLIAKEKCENPLNSSPVLAIFKVEQLIINTDPVASNLSVDVNTGTEISFNIPATDEETPIQKLTVQVVTAPVNASFFGNANGKFTYKSTGNFSGPDAFTFTVTDEAGAVSNMATVTIDVKLPAVTGLPDWQSEDNILSLSKNSQGWSPRNHLPASEKNRYPNSYLEFQYDKSKFFFWDLTNMGWNEYINSIEPSVNMKLFGLYNNGLNVVKMVNRVYSLNDYHYTVNYRDRISNRIIATRKVYVTETWGNSRLKSSEIIEQPELISDLFSDEEGFQALKSAEGDDVYYYKSANLINESASIVTTRDTVTVNFGSTTTINFSAGSLDGQLTMAVAGQPTKGDLSGFVFDSYDSDFMFTYYKGDFTPTTNAATWDSVTYSVSYGNETVTEKKIIRIVPQKVAPVIAAIADQTSPENEIFELDLGISDGDNTLDELDIAISITSTATGFQYNVIAGVLEITPPANFFGEALVEVSVMDPDLQHAHESFKLTITHVNKAPAITIDDSYTLAYNTLFNEVASSSDVDGDVVTLTASGIPEWLTFTKVGTAVGVLNGTPSASDAGVYDITLKATDGELETEKTFSITVTGPITDNPPVVAEAISAMELAKDFTPVTIDVSGVFSDPDGDPITVSVKSNSNSNWVSATIDGNNLTISLVDAKYTGLANITLEGLSKGLSATTSFNVYTTDKAPTVVQGIDNVTVWKNSPDMEISLTGLVVDPDGDQIEYMVDINTNEDLVTATIANETLTLSFDQNNGGEAEIYLKGGAYGKYAEMAFLVTVKDAVPLLNAPVANKSMGKNDAPLTIDISELFVDSDDPSVNLSVKAVTDEDIASATIDNKVLTITPWGLAGATAITILGQSNSNTIEYTFSIEVIDQSPSVKQAVENQSVNKNSNAVEINLSNLFEDPDDVVITMSLASVSNASLATVALDGNQLTVTPAQGLSGSTEITIKGESGGQSVTHTFTFTVEDQAPQKVADLPAVSVDRGATPVKVNLAEYFTDPDGDELTFSVKANSNTSLLSTSIAGGELTLTFATGQTGEANVEISATADGKSASSTFNVKVNTPSAIFDADYVNAFSVYPNPVSDVTTVLWEGDHTISQVSIKLTDLTGRMVNSQLIEQLNPGERFNIAMDNVGKGVYLLNISSGQSEFTTRILK